MSRLRSSGKLLYNQVRGVCRGDPAAAEGACCVVLRRSTTHDAAQHAGSDARDRRPLHRAVRGYPKIPGAEKRHARRRLGRICAVARACCTHSPACRARLCGQSALCPPLLPPASPIHPLPPSICAGTRRHGTRSNQRHSWQHGDQPLRVSTTVCRKHCVCQLLRVASTACLNRPVCSRFSTRVSVCLQRPPRPWGLPPGLRKGVESRSGDEGLGEVRQRSAFAVCIRFLSYEHMIPLHPPPRPGMQNRRCIQCTQTVHTTHRMYLGTLMYAT